MRQATASKAEFRSALTHDFLILQELHTNKATAALSRAPPDVGVVLHVGLSTELSVTIENLRVRENLLHCNLIDLHLAALRHTGNSPTFAVRHDLNVEVLAPAFLAKQMITRKSDEILDGIFGEANSALLDSRFGALLSFLQHQGVGRRCR